MERGRVWDVVVVGGGNAALSAAVTAREAGASVLVLEHAPRSMRGGNSRHTRNLRAMHTRPTSVLTKSYLEDEYWDGLRRVTGGNTDEQLARMTIRASADALPFLERCGVRFQPSLTGTLNLSRTTAFFLGGGKALLNAAYVTAERLGVAVLYDTEVQELVLDDGFVRRLVVVSGGFPLEAARACSCRRCSRRSRRTRWPGWPRSWGWTRPPWRRRWPSCTASTTPIAPVARSASSYRTGALVRHTIERPDPTAPN